ANRIVAPRLRKMVVRCAEDRCYLLRDATGNDHQVGQAWRGPKRLGPEASDVDPGGRRRDHLDCAEREAELGRPHRVATAPSDQLAQRGGQDVLAQRFREGFYSQSRPPFFQMWARAISRMPMKTSISIRPNHFSCRSRTA